MLTQYFPKLDSEKLEECYKAMMKIVEEKHDEIFKGRDKKSVHGLNTTIVNKALGRNDDCLLHATGITCNDSNCNTCKSMQFALMVENHYENYSSQPTQAPSKTTCDYWKIPNTLNAYLCSCNNKIVSKLDFEYCPYCSNKINIKVIK